MACRVGASITLECAVPNGLAGLNSGLQRNGCNGTGVVYVIAIAVDHAVMGAIARDVLRRNGRVASVSLLGYKIIDRMRIEISGLEGAAHAESAPPVAVAGLTQRVDVLLDRINPHRAEMRAGCAHRIARATMVDDLVAAFRNAMQQPDCAVGVEGFALQTEFVRFQLG